jgi:hypothetical protein
MLRERVLACGASLRTSSFCGKAYSVFLQLQLHPLIRTPLDFPSLLGDPVPIALTNTSSFLYAGLTFLPIRWRLPGLMVVASSFAKSATNSSQSSDARFEGETIVHKLD